MQLIVILLLLIFGSSIDEQSLKLIGDITGGNPQELLSEADKIGQILSCFAPAQPHTAPPEPAGGASDMQPALAPIKNIAQNSVYTALSQAINVNCS